MMLPSAVVVVLLAWTIWLVGRCYFGFHGETVMERRGQAYEVQWRCQRCMQVASTSEYKPAPRVRGSLQAQRIHRDLGRVVPMRKKAS